MTSSINIIDLPANINEIELENTNLWYFSQDFFSYQNILEKIPVSCTVEPIGDIINLIAEEIRHDIVQIDQTISNGDFSLPWLASSLAERNPFQSDLYLNLCQAIALVRNTSRGMRHIVIVDDRELGNALAEVCRISNNSTYRNGKLNIPKSRYLFKKIRALIGWLKYTLKMQYFFSKKTVPPKVSSLKNLFIKWAGNDSFSRNSPKIKDDFYGYLVDWITADRNSLAWIANPMSWISSDSRIIEHTKKSTDTIILMPSLFGLKTLMKACVGWFIFPWSTKSTLILGGINLSPLLKYLIHDEMCQPQILHALLYQDVAHNLKKMGFMPDKILYPFENQPWEKILILGIRKEFPKTKIIGVLQSTIAHFYLSCYPSKKQWVDGIVPDLLATIGPFYQQNLLDLGAPANRVFVGGALRYSEFVRPTARLKQKGKITHGVLLVSCPMNFEQSIELIYKASLAIKEMHNVKLLINFHPKMSEIIYKKIRKKLISHIKSPNIQFVPGPARDWLKNTDVLLYNSSGTVFDATSIGIPSIYVNPFANLDLDKLSMNQDTSCRNVFELRDKIKLLLSDPSRRKIQLDTARHMMESYFAVAVEKDWRTNINKI